MLYRLIKIVIDELKHLETQVKNNPEFAEETRLLIKALQRYVRYL